MNSVLRLMMMLIVMIPDNDGDHGKDNDFLGCSIPNIHRIQHANIKGKASLT